MTSGELSFGLLSDSRVLVRRGSRGVSLDLTRTPRASLPATPARRGHAAKAAVCLHRPWPSGLPYTRSGVAVATPLPDDLSWSRAVFVALDAFPDIHLPSALGTYLGSPATGGIRFLLVMPGATLHLVRTSLTSSTHVGFSAPINDGVLLFFAGHADTSSPNLLGASRSCAHTSCTPPAATPPHRVER